MKLNKKGFTLIELMVVIAIIAILATVVLISLQSARDAAEDANRTAALAQVRSFAEVYFAQDLDYTALSTPEDPLLEIIREYGHSGDYTQGSDDGVLRIHIDDDEYCASMELKSGKFLCVDSNLAIKEYANADALPGTYACEDSANNEVTECP